jgi:tetratricopeptide (TPR) repeat protein
MMSEAERLYRKGTELVGIDPARAAQYLTRSLELNPGSPPALYNRAVALAGIGRDAEAIADVERLEKIAPEIGKKLRLDMMAAAEPYTDIAKEEFRAGNFQTAISKCNSALTYCPNYGDALVVKGLALKELGEPEKALECYNKAAEVEPNNYFAYINRAELLHEQKRLHEALADFSKAVEVRPEEPDAYSGRSDVYSDLHMTEKAAADKVKEMKLRSERNAEDDP